MQHSIRLIALVGVTWVGILVGCAGPSGSEWQRADRSPETAASRELRAKDVAACTTQVGAPSPGTQSTMSVSRGQFQSCMHARGWTKAP